MIFIINIITPIFYVYCYKFIGRGEFMRIRYPISIKLNITKKCNLRCKHCFINEYQGEMPIEEIFDLIDDFHKNRLPILFITGGEPFIRNDLIDILLYLKNTSINVNLATNGTLIN